MQNLIAIGAGGAIGALLRYGIAVFASNDRLSEEFGFFIALQHELTDNSLTDSSLSQVKNLVNVMEKSLDPNFLSKEIVISFKVIIYFKSF